MTDQEIAYEYFVDRLYEEGRKGLINKSKYILISDNLLPLLGEHTIEIFTTYMNEIPPRELLNDVHYYESVSFYGLDLLIISNKKNIIEAI